MTPRPEQHPGRSCSPDCAEYGCAPWTAVDELELRKAQHVKAERELACGCYAGDCRHVSAGFRA